MHNITTGIDIIEIDRIREAIDTWGSKFLNRVYTQSEQDICKQSNDSLAGRFAAKEAVLKAINTSVPVCNWREIEILASANNRPLVKLHGNISAECKERGIKGFDVSISHCRDYAIAVAVAQC